MNVHRGWRQGADFTLPNQDRETVTLSEQLKTGPVVLAFFPAAFSSVCTAEMCKFRDSAAQLNTVGARVLGISVDSFFALKAWADAEKLNFPLLSDFNKTVIQQYGVVNPDMIGLKNISKRAVVRDRQERRRAAPGGARGCAERAGLRQGQSGAREVVKSARRLRACLSDARETTS